MAKREEFVLTIEQCQKIAETSALARNNFPKKWGEKPVSDEDQLIGREDVNEIYKTLRGYSAWMQGIGVDYRLIFGNKADWFPADADGDRLVGVAQDDSKINSWKMEDPKKTYRLKLGKEALSGVVWCCILRLHPHTPMPLSNRDSIETWWSIAEAVGKATAVKKYIGLAAAKRTEWEDDPEPAAPPVPEAPAPVEK